MAEHSLVPGNFILDHGEQFHRCPYSVAHTITNAKLTTHLVKCRKAYEKECEANGIQRSEFMRHCKWNHKHVVHAPEQRFHEQSCADQYKVVETIRYHGSDDFRKLKEEDEDRRRKEREAEKEKERQLRKKQKKEHKEKERKRERDERDRRDRYDNGERDRHRDRDRDHHHRERNHAQGAPAAQYKEEDMGDRIVRDYGHGLGIPSKDEEEDYQGRPNKRQKNNSTYQGDDGNKDNIWGSDAEDWEAESKGYEPAYNPGEKLQTKHVLYHPIGLCKSERKQHRLEQKRKYLGPGSGSQDSSYEYFEVDGCSSSSSDQEEVKDVKERKPFIKVEPKTEPMETDDNDTMDMDYGSNSSSSRRRERSPEPSPKPKISIPGHSRSSSSSSSSKPHPPPPPTSTKTKEQREEEPRPPRSNNKPSRWEKHDKDQKNENDNNRPSSSSSFVSYAKPDKRDSSSSSSSSRPAPRVRPTPSTEDPEDGEYISDDDYEEYMGEDPFEGFEG